MKLTEKNWIKRHYATAKRGNLCGLDCEYAKCFCLSGFLTKFHPDKIAAAQQLVAPLTLETFNDKSAWSAVSDLLKKLDL